MVCPRCGGSRAVYGGPKTTTVTSMSFEVECIDCNGMMVDKYGVTWPMYPGNWFMLAEENIVYIITTYGVSFNFRTEDDADLFRKRNGFA